ncbi:MAG: hypothetical protein ACE14T_07430 [Syntrophales bacterium]
MRSVDEARNLLAQGRHADIDVWQSPFDVIHDDGLFRLIRYYGGQKTFSIPVLQVSSYIYRPYILDLQPDVSIVKMIQGHGFAIYQIDWGYPQRIHRCIDIEDYIDYIDFCVNTVREETGASQVTLYGCYLGGTLSIVYSALKPKSIRNLIVQASPVDFKNAAKIRLCTEAGDTDRIGETPECIPADLLHPEYAPGEDESRSIEKHLDNIDKFLRVERWLHDCPGIPASAYRRYSREWCGENKLIKGEFSIFGCKVDLSRIDMPTLVITAHRDYIAPPASTSPFLDIISSRDKEHLAMDKKHIGLYVSSDAHRELWPRVCRWLADRS